MKRALAAFLVSIYVSACGGESPTSPTTPTPPPVFDPGEPELRDEGSIGEHGPIELELLTRGLENATEFWK